MKASPSPKSISNKKINPTTFENQKPKQNRLQPPNFGLAKESEPIKLNKAPPVSNIDRMKLLNDLDEYDEKEEFIPSIEEVKKQFVPKRKTHEPYDKDQALNCLRMLKDMTLFSSPLSQ